MSANVRFASLRPQEFDGANNESVLLTDTGTQKHMSCGVVALKSPIGSIYGVPG